MLVFPGLAGLVHPCAGFALGADACDRGASQPTAPELPYKFRVLKVSGTTAYLSTPRNVDVPAFRALGALFPTIDTKDNNNPEFIAVGGNSRRSSRKHAHCC